MLILIFGFGVKSQYISEESINLHHSHFNLNDTPPNGFPSLNNQSIQSMEGIPVLLVKSQNQKHLILRNLLKKRKINRDLAFLVPVKRRTNQRKWRKNRLKNKVSLVNLQGRIKSQKNKKPRALKILNQGRHQGKYPRFQHRKRMTQMNLNVILILPWNEVEIQG